MIQIVSNQRLVVKSVPINDITDEDLYSKIVVMRQTLSPKCVSYGIMIREPFVTCNMYQFIDISKPGNDIGNAWGYKDSRPRNLISRWSLNDPHHEFFVFDSLNEFAIWLVNETNQVGP